MMKDRTMLEAYIRERRRNKEILLMTHIVIGYPSMEQSYAMVRAMVTAGVDLMELQIPFSEPIADGPVILKANQEALGAGIRVEDCLAFGREVAGEFNIPFLFMTYYNILFRYGVARVAQDTADSGLTGAIVPDLPPEEADDYLACMAAHDLAPVFIFAPTTEDRRMAMIAEHAKGMVYCVARKGVTGDQTDFSMELDAYLKRCRAAVDLPLAVGFGVKEKADVDFLRGKADIAVIGTQTIRLVEQNGIHAIAPFIQELR